MTQIDIQALRRQQSDHRTQREAMRADYRAKLERLRHGFPAHAEHHLAPAVFEGAGGGYRPHTTTHREPLRPDFDADPFPRELVAQPGLIEALTGRSRG